jgi:hypothetical protein
MVARESEQPCPNPTAIITNDFSSFYSVLKRHLEAVGSSPTWSAGVSRSIGFYHCSIFFFISLPTSVQKAANFMIATGLLGQYSYYRDLQSELVERSSYPGNSRRQLGYCGSRH